MASTRQVLVRRLEKEGRADGGDAFSGDPPRRRYGKSCKATHSSATRLAAGTASLYSRPEPRLARDEKYTLGIDEAGRGPCLGPMVLSAVVLSSTAARILSRVGLRDSKSYGGGTYAIQRRLEFATKVKQLASWTAIEIVDVAEIDKRVVRGELNVLEREVATRLIERAPGVDQIIADGKVLFGPLRQRFHHLIAYDHGESRHAAVAAASILAKSRRDALFSCIARRYSPAFGPVSGGGYVNPATRQFLLAYTQRFGRLPPEARRSWPYSYLESTLSRPS